LNREWNVGYILLSEDLGLQPRLSRVWRLYSSR